MTDQAKAPGIRERNRREISAEIITIARTQLTEEGVPGLSLRSISRDMGMASSAIYRYFASRDELLTALIIEAYDDLAATVVEADESVSDQDDYEARWLSICGSMRAWARRDPQRWGLLYGTPVTGYNAPEDTVGSAIKVGQPLLQLAADALGKACETSDPSQNPVINPNIGADLSESSRLSPGNETTSIAAWSHLLGIISLEVFGHLTNVVDDLDEYFRIQMMHWAGQIGLDD